MRKILSVSVSPELKKKINRAAKKYKIPKSDIVKTALDKYLATLDFKALKDNLIPYAERKSYFTDEDIFGDKDIS